MIYSWNIKIDKPNRICGENGYFVIGVRVAAVYAIFEVGKS